MSTAIGWVLFGFGVWMLSILVHAFQRRLAPEMDYDSGVGGAAGDAEDEPARGSGRRGQDRDRDIQALRERVEVLEAIVTDRRYQFDEALLDPEQSRRGSSARSE